MQTWKSPNGWCELGGFPGVVCKDLVGGVLWDGSSAEKFSIELLVDVWPWICRHFKYVIFDSVEQLLSKYFLNYLPCRIYLWRRLLFLEFIGDHSLPVITFHCMMLNQYKNEITQNKNKMSKNECTGTETFSLVTTQTSLWLTYTKSREKAFLL